LIKKPISGRIKDDIKNKIIYISKNIDASIGVLFHKCTTTYFKTLKFEN